jgi:hypothetical protein
MRKTPASQAIPESAINGRHLRWPAGVFMTVVMKNRKNNVLPFPELPEEPGTSTIIAQIGSERFAIHIQVQDLPPASRPVVMPERSAKKAVSKIVK